MTLSTDKQMLNACKEGNLEEAKRLLAEDGNLNYADPGSGLTPLMGAIEHKHADVITWLLSKGCRVDYDRHNTWQNTALHYDSVLVSALGNRMREEAVNLRNQDGNTAAALAIQWNNGNVEALQGLLSVTSVNWNILKDGKSLQSIARERGNEEIINLLEMNTEIHEKDLTDKRLKKLKNNKSVFTMKISVNNKEDPKECFNKLSTYMGEQSKLMRGFVKKDQEDRDFKAGLFAVGKDNSSTISSYIILQDSVEDKDDNKSHSFEICFKITENVDENVKKAVDFISNNIYKCFNEQQLTIRKVFLKGEETDETREANYIILPCLKSSLGYLFNYAGVKYSKIVTKLVKADPHWLSILFSQEYSIKDQINLFGDESSKKLHLQKSEEGITILKHMAKSENLMKTQQEEFISMLIHIDEELYPDKPGVADRVISKLKDGLQSSSQLTELIQSVKCKSQISTFSMHSKIVGSFVRNIAKGVGLCSAQACY